MRNLLIRIVLVVGAICAALCAATPPARADCAGPMVEVSEKDLDRANDVTIIGRFWGDNCYDTGAPPAGEGTLGKPIDPIEIVFVQNGTDFPVALGAADEDYEFSVTLPVPWDLEPGPAQMVVRSIGGDWPIDAPVEVMVTDAATSAFRTTITRFGPEASDVAPVEPAAVEAVPDAAARDAGAPPEPDAESRSSDQADSGNSELLLWAVGGLAVGATLVAVGVAVATSMRRPGR